MTNAFRTLAATLALSAMLLRAVLPAGWMPDFSGPDSGALVICSVDGVHHGGPAHDPLHDSRDEHNFACPFAAVAHLAPPQSPPAILAPIALARIAPAFVEPSATPDPHDPGHAPRGPPFSV